MELFRQILLAESEKARKKDADFAITSINDVYKEWKKTKRRINAVDLITTSVNKLAKIDPSVIPHIHDMAKKKMAVIIMRCLDGPVAKNIDTKKATYKKLWPMMSALQAVNPNTGTGGNLREIVMTRLSTNITHENDVDNKVFVAYEPVVSSDYLTYLFGTQVPKKVFKMQSLSLPEDFDTLVNTLIINYKKAILKFNNK